MSETASVANWAATGTASPARAESLRPLLAIVLAAVVVRALTSFYLPSVVYPDETFQLIEQAERLVTGRGVVPWEFQVGARSWLLPGLLAPLVAAGRALSPDPRLALAFVAAAMTAVSAACVGAAYLIGRKRGDQLDGLFAAGLVGLWSELIYFSPHVLADTVSGALLLGGLAACTAPERPRRLVWGGLLLGAAFVVRIQLAPAIGVAGLLICGRDLRRYLLVGAGFALPIAALGLVDWLTWGAPFHSVLAYLKVNGSGVADVFGREPALFYLLYEDRIWGFAAPLVVLTACLGARRAPVPAACAAAILLTFSLVGHKEPRFIYPALLLVFVLCGLGSAEIFRWARVRLPDERSRRIAAVAMAAAWGVASALSATGPVMRANWSRDAGTLRAFNAVNADPQSCGLALTPAIWSRAGFSHLRADVQLYTGDAPQRAYNWLLSFNGPLALQSLRPGYTLQACYGPDGGCLYRRPGTCSGDAPTLQADAPPEVTKVLDKFGYRPIP